SEGVERARRDALPGATPGSTASTGIDANGNPAAMRSDTPANQTEAPGIDTQLDTTGTSRGLQDSTLATRDRPLRQVERSAIAGRGVIRQIERETIAVQGDARTKVDASVRKAEAARLELDKSISLARAANADRWDGARQDVIDHYQDYTKALSTAHQAAVDSGVRFETTASDSTANPPPSPKPAYFTPAGVEYTPCRADGVGVNRDLVAPPAGQTEISVSDFILVVKYPG
ncbi:MAG: hypothetical protein H7067_05045, partial [Burkholderiales bacterium]|nr:hypothetical protein [Opitutaceae bacterium]